MRSRLMGFFTGLVAWLVYASCGCSNEPGAGAPTQGGAGGSASSTNSSTTTSTTAVGGSSPVGPWIPVPGLEWCDGVMLDLTQAPWPARAWTSCGPGCQTSEVADFASQYGALHTVSTGRWVDGAIYLRTFTEGLDERYQVLERLSDGAALMVLRTGPDCWSAAIKEDAAFVVETGWQDAEGVLRASGGRYDPATGLIVDRIAFEMSSIHPAWFSWDDGWGYIDGGSIRVTTGEPATALTTVFSSDSWQMAGKARGELVAWVDWGAVPSPIRSWTRAAGQRILIAGPWDVAGLGMDDGTIAWVGVHGPSTIIGAYEAAELYWSPWSTDPAQIAVTQGPDLTNKLAGGIPVAVAGDWIAMSGGDPDHGTALGVFVVHRPTQQLWAIPARAGTILFLAALSTEEVVAMETDLSKNRALFQRYVRFDLGALDALAVGWSL